MIRKHFYKLLESFLGFGGVLRIPVGIPHHLHVQAGDLQLRVRGPGVRRKEYDEVLILILRLQKVLRTAFFVKGIANSEIGFGGQFAVGVGIDQGLERQPSFDELALLSIFLSGFEEGLVRRHHTLLEFRPLLTASPCPQENEEEYVTQPRYHDGTSHNLRKPSGKAGQAVSTTRA